VKSELSPRDWQEISTYLDQQLSPQARQRLETRLQHEPQLRSALDDLRILRVVLRSQPRLRAPRNFTLSPEMAGGRQKAPAYPALRLVTVLASLLFVVLLVGDLIGQRAIPAAQPLQLESAMQLQDAASQEQPEALAKVAPPSVAAELPSAKQAATPPSDLQLFAAPAAEAGSSQYPAPSGTEDQGQVMETSAEEEPNPVLKETGVGQAAAPEQSQVFGLDQRTWRGLEILTGLIAFLAGLAWWIAWRRS